MTSSLIETFHFVPSPVAGLRELVLNIADAVLFLPSGGRSRRNVDCCRTCQAIYPRSARCPPSIKPKSLPMSRFHSNNSAIKHVLALEIIQNIDLNGNAQAVV